MQTNKNYYNEIISYCNNWLFLRDGDNYPAVAFLKAFDQPSNNRLICSAWTDRMLYMIGTYLPYLPALSNPPMTRGP